MLNKFSVAIKEVLKYLKNTPVGSAKVAFIKLVFGVSIQGICITYSKE
jgi:hypothetical protein